MGPPFTGGADRMRCVECGSDTVNEPPERTAQEGYRRFRRCRRPECTSHTRWREF